MSRLFFLLLLGCSLGAWGQSSSAPANPAPPSSSSSSSSSSSGATQDSGEKPRKQNLEPPHSDRINADDLSDEPGDSSSKDTQVDLSPPSDDAKKHPRSSEALEDEGSAGDVGEFHPWDPHKAAKNVEVGDYYFKQKNYVAAESRYREALLYKDNDAVATFKLAVCLEKMKQPAAALEEYENYLKILPHGPEAAGASKAISRLKGPTTSAQSSK